jgi:hypothetical protein
LACAAVAVLFFFVDLNDPDEDTIGLLLYALSVCSFVLLPAFLALEAFKAGNRLSGLLRRPSDSHTATVMASKRVGAR